MKKLAAFALLLSLTMLTIGCKPADTTTPADTTPPADTTTDQATEPAPE